MKNLILTTVMMFAFCFCYSQNKTNIKSATTNTIPVLSPNTYSNEAFKSIKESPKLAIKDYKDNSKYVGRYHLKNADSLISYDYFDIKENDGKFYCVRESKVIFLEAKTNKIKNTSNHFDCEVPYINIEEGKISFKFNDNTYNYKFRISPYVHRYEIVIIENALIYEKR
jgi:hypothetical protein